MEKMKSITISFLTEKGELAYKKSEEEGKSRPKWEKKAVACIFKDEVLQEKPLIIFVKIKSPRMAIQIKLDEKIKEGLKKFGAVIKKDYNLQIKY